MNSPEARKGPFRSGDPQDIRPIVDNKPAGGPVKAAGFVVNGMNLPDGPMVLNFYRNEPVLVRSVEIEGGLTESERYKLVVAAMAQPDWSRLEYKPTQVHPDDSTSTAEVIDLQSIKAQTERRWPEPSPRTLDLEHREPGLFAAIRRLGDRHWRFPFARRDSE